MTWPNNPPWRSTPLPHSCMDCWMLSAGDRHCQYERERNKVVCQCVAKQRRRKKGRAPRA